MIRKIAFWLLLVTVPGLALGEVGMKPLVGLTGLDNQIFPAYVLSVAGNSPMEIDPADVPGGKVGQYVIESADAQIGSVIASDVDAAIEFSVSAERFIRPSSWSGNIKGGVAYQVFPLIDWNYEQLNALTQPEPAAVTFKLKVGGVEKASKKVVVRFRAISDVPYGFISDGNYVSTAQTFASFVNENHPWIDSLLQEALESGLVSSFDGYQSRSGQQVSQQVFSIWNILQKRGVKYSSITTSSGATDGIYSQSVRFLDQSITNTQANCVDGTILFASILKKIGIEPLIVMIPGHMFLGFYVDRDMTQPLFLETTMMGTGNVRALAADGSAIGALSSLLGDETQDAASARTYTAALQYASNTARENWDKFASGEPGYVLLTVKDARALGIHPVNYVGGRQAAPGR